MPRSRDETPAVRVYTVCDESKYLIVRNVPSLGCGDELLKLFSSYGEVEECKPMDAEDCDEYTDVFWIKFHLVSNSRFAKRKLDEYVFLGNRLQVSYAPQFENLSDTKEKLESRGKEVNSRLNTGKTSKFEGHSHNASINHGTFANSTAGDILTVLNSGSKTDSLVYETRTKDPPLGRVSSDQDYFPSHSMNQTVKLVRERLSKHCDQCRPVLRLLDHMSVPWALHIGSLERVRHVYSQAFITLVELSDEHLTPVKHIGQGCESAERNAPSSTWSQ